MSFKEFLTLIRERIGHYCNDGYWQWKYDILPDKSQEYVESQLPLLAINAIGTDYVSKLPSPYTTNGF